MDCHTVSAGMNVCIETGRLPPEAASTAEFIENVDQLFNCFNSRTPTSTAAMRHAMSETSGHKEFLKSSLDWLQTLSSKGKKQPYCIKGWQISVNALLGLWQVLHDDFGLSYLLTSRLNQDPLENFFSIIRHKGIQRVNPDAAEFKAAFRQCMVDSIMQPGKNANCKEDVDKFLLTLKHVETNLPSPIPNQHPSPVHNMPDTVKSILSVCAFPPEVGISDHDSNVLAYIGGYIVAKLKKKGIACDECLAKISGEILKDDQRHLLLPKKNMKTLKLD